MQRERDQSSNREHSVYGYGQEYQQQPQQPAQDSSSRFFPPILMEVLGGGKRPPPTPNPSNTPSSSKNRINWDSPGLTTRFGGSNPSNFNNNNDGVSGGKDNLMSSPKSFGLLDQQQQQPEQHQFFHDTFSGTGGQSSAPHTRARSRTKSNSRERSLTPNLFGSSPTPSATGVFTSGGSHQHHNRSQSKGEEIEGPPLTSMYSSTPFNVGSHHHHHNGSTGGALHLSRASPPAPLHVNLSSPTHDMSMDIDQSYYGNQTRNVTADSSPSMMAVDNRQIYQRELYSSTATVGGEGTPFSSSSFSPSTPYNQPHHQSPETPASLSDRSLHTVTFIYPLISSPSISSKGSISARHLLSSIASNFGPILKQVEKDNGIVVVYLKQEDAQNALTLDDTLVGSDGQGGGWRAVVRAGDFFGCLTPSTKSFIGGGDSGRRNIAKPTASATRGQPLMKDVRDHSNISSPATPSLPSILKKPSLTSSSNVGVKRSTKKLVLDDSILAESPSSSSFYLGTPSRINVPISGRTSMSAGIRTESVVVGELEGTLHLEQDDSMIIDPISPVIDNSASNPPPIVSSNSFLEGWKSAPSVKARKQQQPDEEYESSFVKPASFFSLISEILFGN